MMGNAGKTGSAAARARYPYGGVGSDTPQRAGRAIDVLDGEGGKIC